MTITAVFSAIVVALTALAFWKKEPMLYMLGVIGWLTLAFILYNQTYPAGNTYLPYAVTGFCLYVTLIMAVQVVRTFYSTRTRPPTSRDIQDEHKKKVEDLTRRRPTRPWEL